MCPVDRGSDPVDSFEQRQRQPHSYGRPSGVPERLFDLEWPAGIDVLMRGKAMLGRVVPEVRADVVQHSDRRLFRPGAQRGHGEHNVVG